MGIIIIDPPKKPEAAAPLSDEQWGHVWRFCSLHTQASMRAQRCERSASSIAASAIGFMIGAIAGAGAMALVGI